MRAKETRFLAPQLGNGTGNYYITLLAHARVSANVFGSCPESAHVRHRRSFRHLLQKARALAQ
jgi:hypothetical protein